MKVFSSLFLIFVTVLTILVANNFFRNNKKLGSIKKINFDLKYSSTLKSKNEIETTTNKLFHLKSTETEEETSVQSQEDHNHRPSELKEFRALQLKNWMMDLENATKLTESDLENFKISRDQTYFEFTSANGADWKMDIDLSQQLRRIQIRFPDGRLIGKIYLKGRLIQMSYQDLSGKVLFYKPET